MLQVMKYKPAAPVTGMDVGEAPPVVSSCYLTHTAAVRVMLNSAHLVFNDFQ